MGWFTSDTDIKKENVDNESNNLNSVNVSNDIKIGSMPLDINMCLLIITVIKIIELLFFLFNMCRRGFKRKYNNNNSV